MNVIGLKKHVETWISRLGSQEAVAKRLGISGTALSQFLGDKYGADTSNIQKLIVQRLDYKESTWSIVPTITNYRKIEFVVRSCKEESLWMAISNKAGSGKTKTLEHLFNADHSGSIILIQAEEWNSRQFLLNLAEKTCGIPKKGYTDIPTLIRLITDYLRVLDNPLLIIDEADKLKPASFRTLIPLYNKTEDNLGCVLSGTENLRKEILRGVKNNTKGYDEIDTRLGRTYIELPGATESEVKNICLANRLDEYSAERIWEEIEKVKKPAKVRNGKGETTEKMIFFCEDLRRLMRLIKREQLSKISN